MINAKSLRVEANGQISNHSYLPSLNGQVERMDRENPRISIDGHQILRTPLSGMAIQVTIKWSTDFKTNMLILGQAGDDAATARGSKCRITPEPAQLSKASPF